MSQWMVFDVESVGLHGEGFAVGWVIIDDQGTETENGILATDPRYCEGDLDSFSWITENVPAEVRSLRNCHSARAMRSVFWALCVVARTNGTLLAADVPWPVEARFLAKCIDDQLEERRWQGPYPLIDIASVRLAAGLDPLGIEPRLERELPVHDPLADARQSARLLIEAFDKIRGLEHYHDQVEGALV